MRRNEKEITDKKEIEAILHKSRVCRIGMTDDSGPYIVPMSFGYSDNAVYLHSALEGRKIDIMRQNPRVCFECDTLIEIVTSDKPCNWGMKYRSVIGFGQASFIDDPEEKRTALSIIMEKYSGQSFKFKEPSLQMTAVIKIDISHMSGKQSV